MGREQTNGTRAGRVTGAADGVEGFFSSGGPLSSGGGYRVRPEQVRFAEAVRRCIDGGGGDEPSVLLSDCPPGTGKSLGYLVPLILAGSRVVVSTATIALQHQLVTKDLPRVVEAARGVSGGAAKVPTFALLKGRSNFLCEDRFENVLAEGAPIGALEELEGLDLWRRATESGDREELDSRPRVWSEVASDSDDCAPERCRFRERCFYFSQRSKAEDADILVVNHALLLANAASGYNVFDVEGRVLVADEAHRLEEAMGEAFGAHVTRRRVRYVVRVAEKRAKDVVRYTQRVEDAADLFFDGLRQHAGLGDKGAAPPAYARLVESLSSLGRVLANDPAEEVNKLGVMVSKLRRDLKGFYEPQEDSHAYAVIPPRKNKGGGMLAFPELKSWLVETGPVFAGAVLGREEGARTVLTSATLAAGGSFAYARGRLGVGLLPEGSRVEEIVASETFDHRRNSLLYLERGLSSADGAEEVAKGVIRRTEELVDLSAGRALVLCSTSRAVERFRRSFKSPYPARFQGDASPSRLVRWLKETEGGVLIGTKTFFEGVDVAGPALSLVVVDRVPFAPPDDPVVAKLCEKAGKAWFTQVSLPRAQVTLRQGAGRLLRTVEDRGVVAILDPRIGEKGWGRSVLKALPPSPTTGSLEDVGRFFSRVAP